MESGAAYQNLAEASVCRAQADWLIGINATRAYTTTYFHRLIVGRVQTPTLAMIVKRDQEIADFQKEQYFVTHLLSEGLDAVSMHFKDQEEAEALADKCRGKEAVVCSVKKKKKVFLHLNSSTLHRCRERLTGCLVIRRNRRWRQRSRFTKRS